MSPFQQTAGQAERRRLEEQSAHRRRLSDGENSIEEGLLLKGKARDIKGDQKI